mgnify:CR=1 FL=1|jgi:hypothetical protein
MEINEIHLPKVDKDSAEFLTLTNNIEGYVSSITRKELILKDLELILRNIPASNVKLLCEDNLLKVKQLIIKEKTFLQELMEIHIIASQKFIGDKLDELNMDISFT